MDRVYIIFRIRTQKGKKIIFFNFKTIPVQRALSARKRIFYLWKPRKMFSWVYKKSTRLDTLVDTRFEFRDNRQMGDKKKNRKLVRPSHWFISSGAQKGDGRCITEALFPADSSAIKMAGKQYWRTCKYFFCYFLKQGIRRKSTKKQDIKDDKKTESPIPVPTWRAFRLAVGLGLSG